MENKMLTPDKLINELVRCKDCEHCNHSTSLLTYRCDRFLAVVRPNDYCSYGKEKR